MEKVIAEVRNPKIRKSAVSNQTIVAIVNRTPNFLNSMDAGYPSVRIAFGQWVRWIPSQANNSNTYIKGIVRKQPSRKIRSKSKDFLDRFWAPVLNSSRRQAPGNAFLLAGRFELAGIGHETAIAGIRVTEPVFLVGADGGRLS